MWGLVEKLMSNIDEIYQREKQSLVGEGDVPPNQHRAVQDSLISFKDSLKIIFEIMIDDVFSHEDTWKPKSTVSSTGATYDGNSTLPNSIRSIPFTLKSTNYTTEAVSPLNSEDNNTSNISMVSESDHEHNYTNNHHQNNQYDKDHDHITESGNLEQDHNNINNLNTINTYYDDNDMGNWNIKINGQTIYNHDINNDYDKNKSILSNHTHAKRHVNQSKINYSHKDATNNNAKMTTQTYKQIKNDKIIENKKIIESINQLDENTKTPYKSIVKSKVKEINLYEKSKAESKLDNHAFSNIDLLRKQAKYQGLETKQNDKKNQNCKN